jgi:hypothetical protein
MLAWSGNLSQIPNFWNCSACKARFFRTSGPFKAHTSPRIAWGIPCTVYLRLRSEPVQVTRRSRTGSREWIRSQYRTRRSETENAWGFNLAAVKHKTVQVTRLPLWLELLKIRHNVLYKAWTDWGLVYIAHTHNGCYYVPYMQNCKLYRFHNDNGKGPTAYNAYM